MKYINATVREVVDERTLFHNTPKTYLFSKRVFDIIVSVFGLILLSPLFLVTAAAIKMDSIGPVLFVQERCGFKGGIFKIYKFRSMVSNAEQIQIELNSRNEAGRNMFKIRDDPRVTRVGKIIRKTSIDELPQLLNVLKGNMSLVGPRPPTVSEAANYERWHYLRMSAKPGITGLWQIRCRSTVGFEEMLRLDLKYIRERNFLFDLKIIIKTIPLLLGDDRTS